MSIINSIGLSHVNEDGVKKLVNDLENCNQVIENISEKVNKFKIIK